MRLQEQVDEQSLDLRAVATAQLREFGARMDDFGRELLNAIENAAMVTPTLAPPPQPPEEVSAQPRRRTF